MFPARSLRLSLPLAGVALLAACEVPTETAVTAVAPATPEATTEAPIEVPASPIEDPGAPVFAENEPEVPLLGGYRDPNDPCQRVGDSRFTRRYQADGTDLVACISGGGAATSLVRELGAVPVARTATDTLYQVPQRAAG